MIQGAVICVCIIATIVSLCVIGGVISTVVHNKRIGKKF